MPTNILIREQPEERISRLLAVIGQPARIQILLIIGRQPACVCHMEAVLGMRQASISQHLMVLRKAGLVTTQREGRNIFYHLTDPAILSVLQQAAAAASTNSVLLDAISRRPVPGCPCPQCNPDQEPSVTCEGKPKSKAVQSTATNGGKLWKTPA